MRRRSRAALLIAVIPTAAVCTANEYVGAKACAPCHPAQAALQAKSGHARSLHPAASHPLASAFPKREWLTRDPEFRIRFQQAGTELRVQAYDRENTMDIPVEWAFGAGEQAVTFVTRIDKDWYLEHYYSFFRALGGMGPTPGHNVLHPKTLPEAMGVPYKTLDPKVGILGCFECHSTGPVRIEAGNTLQPGEQGVRCEACHGPGRDHIEAAANGDAAKARQSILNPKYSSASVMLQNCGRCHRPPAGPGVRIDWNYAWNVRHQPVYLARSRCLTESQGKLSCLTCHDPHSPLKTNAAAFYRERCLSCHADDTPATCRQDGSTDCTTCHMPKVTPQPPLRFTNHWIGVYTNGKPLQPVTNAGSVLHQQ